MENYGIIILSGYGLWILNHQFSGGGFAYVFKILRNVSWTFWENLKGWVIKICKIYYGTVLWP